MGDAMLLGSGSSSGLRHKRISKLGFEALSDDLKYSPFIVWVIEDATAEDFETNIGIDSVVKVLAWEAYQKLSEADKNDPTTIWVISNLSEEEYARMNIDTSSGTKFYNYGGTPSSTNPIIPGVDFKLTKDSTNPVSSGAVWEEVNTIKQNMGGLSFSVTEEGGLRIFYDDGTDTNS